MLFHTLTFGQTPYHYLIGSEDLEGVDIYDIIEKKNGGFVLATDNGIYNYDGYTFKLIEHDSKFSRSFFNLIANEEDAIYCNNLNGEIFQIFENKTELIHTVPDSLFSSHLSFNMLTNEKLLVHAATLYEINIKDPNKKIKTIIQKDIYHQVGASPKKTITGAFFLQFWMDSVAYITENKVETKPILLENNLIPDSITILDYFSNGQDQFCSNKGNIVYQLSNNSNQILLTNPIIGPKELCRTYGTEDKIWFASHTSGIYCYNIVTKTISNKLFENYFVSVIYEDNNGNIILGTFDQGLIVIPKNEATTLLDSEILNASIFTISDEMDLFLGGYDGNIYKLRENKIDTVKKIGFGQIEFLDISRNGKHLFFGVNNGCILNLSTEKISQLQASSLKNVSEINDSLFLIASSNQSEIALVTSDTVLSNSRFSGRSNAIIALSNQQVLIGTSNGLVSCHKDNLMYTEPIKNEGIRILATCFLNKNNNEVLIGTEGTGVLIWNGEKIQPWYPVKNTIKQIVYWNNHYILHSKKGLSILDSLGNLKRKISFSDGLLSLTPIKIAIIKDHLFCLHNTGLQKLFLPSLFNTNRILSIQDIDFKVNNTKRDYTSKLYLDHSENKIDVSLIAPNLRYQKDISYRFRIRNIEKSWNINSYDKNQITYKTLPPGDYKLEIQLMNGSQMVDSKEISFAIDFPFWQKWWFYLMVALSIALIVSLFFRWRIRIQKEKAERINELNKSKLATIKSQMNPHFIFNSLNSIQDLVLKGDVDNSYSSITTFADLVRKTLEFSEKEHVDFEEEIHLLNQYLKLEKLRFKESLIYSIDTQNINEISIPPILIQPFVENALLHGLLHKQGKKTLKISFTLHDEVLKCSIIDNGIGREKSKEIKNRQNKSYASFSSSATQRRFKILRSLYQQELGFEYEDLYDSEEPAGTKVILTIPIIKNL